jgi:hypothetical protein
MNLIWVIPTEGSFFDAYFEILSCMLPVGSIQLLNFLERGIKRFLKNISETEKILNKGEF